MSNPTYTLTNGDATAVINLVGSALVGLRFGNHAVIPEINLAPKTYAGSLLAPWPNRIEKGHYSLEGNDYQLDVRDGLGNALHGLVDESTAEVVETRSGFVKLATKVEGDAGYPWNLLVEATFELTSTELIVGYFVTNAGAGNAPVGIGTHPYFPFSYDTTIEVNAAIAFVHGSDMLPISHKPASQIGLGPGNAVLVQDLQLDTQFTAVTNPVATLRTGDHSLDIWHENAPWLMIYTTDKFPWESGLGNAIAIEPQTCPANAFNTGEDLRVLASGESTWMRFGIKLRG
jgi:aldose 1-epimerase